MKKLITVMIVLYSLVICSACGRPSNNQELAAKGAKTRNASTIPTSTITPEEPLPGTLLENSTMPAKCWGYDFDLDITEMQVDQDMKQCILDHG